ncbi:MAG TPA: hypothetical protein VE262_08360 [Blastocatellia bacterium]|nr:hypothetical protein [Blastocatellia bacterium]
MRRFLCLVSCALLINFPTLARELCPPCAPNLTPPLGHGAVADGRRKLIVYIDSSWDVTTGNTDPSIWNGLQVAMSMWNAQVTCYYFEIDQENGRNGKDIVIVKTSSSDIEGGCAEWIGSSSNDFIRLSESVPSRTSTEIGALMAHEMGM